MSQQIARHNDKRIDELQMTIQTSLEQVDCPVRHYFLKGMYIREVSCPKGAVIVTKIHKTEHPFTVSKGKTLVNIDGGEWKEVNAPFTGVTLPGTRRVVMVVEDCVWSTYHRFRSIKGHEGELSPEQQEKIVDNIEKRIIQKHKILNDGMDSSSRNRHKLGR